MIVPTEHACGCLYEPHPRSPEGLRVCVKRCAEHQEMPVVPWDTELPVWKEGESK